MSLDYELVQDGTESFQVWTPDNTGAIIGLGETEKAAYTNAVKTLLETAHEIANTHGPISL